MDDGGGARRGRRERAPSCKVAESEESKAEEAREREQNKRKRQEHQKQKETASIDKGGKSLKASNNSKKKKASSRQARSESPPMESRKQPPEMIPVHVVGSMKRAGENTKSDAVIADMLAFDEIEAGSE